MKKLKHSKYRNPGILFELLVRQVTADVLNDSKKPIAERLLNKYFSSDTQLGKELRLYHILMKENYKSKDKAEDLINAVVEARDKLSNMDLRKEKYNLIKEIKEAYPIDDFLRSPIRNYKVLASIYRLFEYYTSNEEYEPTGLVDSKYTLMEHIGRQSKKKNKKNIDRTLSEYSKEKKDIQLLSYKIFVDRFNEKYGSLSDKQKSLLREYINNVANTNSLREYVNSEVPKVTKELINLRTRIKDDVTKIKLKEVISQMNRIKKGRLVDENQISALMLTYELVEELRKVTSRKENLKENKCSGK